MSSPCQSLTYHGTEYIVARMDIHIASPDFLQNKVKIMVKMVIKKASS